VGETRGPTRESNSSPWEIDFVGGGGFPSLIDVAPTSSLNESNFRGEKTFPLDRKSSGDPARQQQERVAVGKRKKRPGRRF